MTRTTERAVVWLTCVAFLAAFWTVVGVGIWYLT
jgi:hypothetical protein